MTNNNRPRDLDYADVQADADAARSQELRKEFKDVREHTNRIRQALRDLPRAAALYGHKVDRTETEEQYLRLIFQEIIGSAQHIADVLDIEL